MEDIAFLRVCKKLLWIPWSNHSKPCVVTFFYFFKGVPCVLSIPSGCMFPRDYHYNTLHQNAHNTHTHIKKNDTCLCFSSSSFFSSCLVSSDVRGFTDVWSFISGDSLDFTYDTDAWSWSFFTWGKSLSSSSSNIFYVPFRTYLSVCVLSLFSFSI